MIVLGEDGYNLEYFFKILSQSYSKWTVNYNKSLTFNCSGIEIEIEISLLTKSGPAEGIKDFDVCLVRGMAPVVFQRGKAPLAEIEF
jgi:hypothetical protein